MTLREYYAGLAMQAIVARDPHGSWHSVGSDAVDLADALCEALRSDPTAASMGTTPSVTLVGRAASRIEQLTPGRFALDAGIGHDDTPAEAAAKARTLVLRLLGEVTP